MEESRTIKDFHPGRIGEKSDVFQETEIIQSDSISDSDINYMDPDEGNLDLNVIEIDDMCVVYGPPDDIFDNYIDLDLEDLDDFDVLDEDSGRDLNAEAIDKISFVYGPPSEIIHHKHK